MGVETPEVPEQSESAATAEKNGNDRALAWGLVAATAAVFWPVTRWLVSETAARSQIRQAAILLGAAAGLVAWRHRGGLRIKGDLCNRTLLLLAAAFGVTAVAGLAGFGLAGT